MLLSISTNESYLLKMRQTDELKKKITKQLVGSVWNRKCKAIVISTYQISIRFDQPDSDQNKHVDAGRLFFSIYQ